MPKCIDGGQTGVGRAIKLYSGFLWSLSGMVTFEEKLMKHVKPLQEASLYKTYLLNVLSRTQRRKHLRS